MTKLTHIVAAALVAGILANSAALAERAAKAPSEKRLAMQERQRACAAEWKTARNDADVKARGWPKYWSACNARIKAAAAQ